LREQARQLAITFDEAAQDARYGERPVAMGHRSKDLGGEFFGKEQGAFGLATGTEIPGAARECQKVLRMALCAPNARTSGLKPSTAEELFYGTNHNRTQRTRARLEENRGR